MSNETMENGAGLLILSPVFHGTGRLVLTVLFGLPPSVRESLLFASSPICGTLQKVLNRSLGGVSIVQTRFAEGPLSGCLFECLSSEKYFMLGSSFEQKVQTILKETVKPGDIVYDVGGHVGYMALLFSALCGPGGHVFTFEPSAINLPRIKRNLQLNQKTNITLVDVAASDAEGTALLKEEGSQSCIVSILSKSDAGSRVRTIRLDDFVYRDGHLPPTFLKVDVEGHAARCLAGMRTILRDGRPPMILELHESDEATEVLKILGAHSYVVSDVDAPDKFPRRIIARPS